MTTHAIAVIGSGSYGTCLAILLGRKGHDVRLWCRSDELRGELAGRRENTVYLPGHQLPESVRVTGRLDEAVAGARIVLGVTPSHAVRDVLGQAAPHMEADVVVVNAAKGLEEQSHLRMDQVYGEILPPEVAARATFLSGPTFAKEVAAGLPSVIVIAGRDRAAARLAQEAFSSDRFRVYSSDDVVGVQLGGALKNVIAICAGICDGLGLGHNARAALITRGLAEIARIGASQGANPLTFAGLSGLGDLVLTCTGDLSRNRKVGLELAAGKKIGDIIAEMRMVAEGVKTARAAHELAGSLGVRSPLSDTAHGILYQDRPVATAIGELMTRSLRDERD
ncbi:MAG TPA: NAD(P)H-dependent glycerol-3-phosphate dehydrogenase [Kofleriaceae bacterium]|nr:NAD(P)H-dependent glycerol-3-phosphate dehydrogenase [Kofleriaceae bacterium]